MPPQGPESEAKTYNVTLNFTCTGGKCAFLEMLSSLSEEKAYIKNLGGKNIESSTSPIPQKCIQKWKIEHHLHGPDNMGGCGTTLICKIVYSHTRDLTSGDVTPNAR